MKDVEKTVPRWLFDYVFKPLAFVLILFGVKTTLTKTDGTKTVYNAKGEKWHWLSITLTDERSHNEHKGNDH